MNRIVLLLITLATLTVAGKLQVVTSIPDIADRVREIGGDKVKVKSLATGREDFHAVPVRPSFLPLLNRAEVLITLGLDAEHAWLPALVKKARNPKIMPGKEGWITLSKGICVLEVPQSINRAEGEQHVDGNPHFNVGPHAGAVMARNIYQILAYFDPSNRELYAKNYALYHEKVVEAVEILKIRGASLRGKKVITYHKDVAYLCYFYGMKEVGAIEVKPGIPTTASHLKTLEESGQSQKVDYILHNQAQSSRVPKKLGKSLSVPVVEVANSVGAKKDITSWIKLQEYNLERLLEAVK